MKAKTIAIWVCGIWFLTSSCVWGVEFGFQPRLQGGVMYYEYEQDNVALGNVRDALFAFGANSSGIDLDSVLATAPEQIAIGEISTSKFKVAGPMATLGGGFTAYAGRFFVDVSAQKAFENSDDDRLTNQRADTAIVPSTTAPFGAGSVGVGGGANVATEGQSDFDSDFEREDYAVSIGFNVTERFVVFTGYKYAETRFDSDVSGTFTLDAVVFDPFDAANNLAITATNQFSGDTKLTFRQFGPFVGVGYAIPINYGILDGQLSTKLAVAFLDGKVNVSNKNFQFVGGPPLPPDSKKIKGDSIGLSIGLNWSGRTGISGLNYLLGINGYQYDFDANRRGDPDFQEFSIGFNAGVGYGF